MWHKELKGHKCRVHRTVEHPFAITNLLLVTSVLAATISCASTAFHAAPNLGKQMFNINQLVIKDLFGNIEQSKNSCVPDRVVNIQSFLPANHNIAGAQDRKLLGKRALLHLEKITELIDAHFSIPKSIQNGNSEGMSQRLEEFGLKSS